MTTAWWLAALAVAGFGPILVQFFINLWRFDIYQFFPAALIGVGCLAVRGLEEVPLPLRPGPAWVTAGLVAGFLGLLAIASWMWSPWLGVQAFLGAWLAAAWWLGGWPLWRAMAPAWLMWLTVVPPPLNLDKRFALQLQEWAVTGSSHVLTWTGVPHTLQGTLIEIPGQRLLVEEACSGINSFLFMTSASVFYALWKRRSLGFLLVLCGLTISCVLAGNLFRITSGAWLVFNWNIDTFSGWRHETLGLTLTATYLAFIAGAEAVLAKLSRRQARLAPIRELGEVVRRWRPVRGLPWLALPLAVLGMVQLGRAWERASAAKVIRSAGMNESARFSMPPTVNGWSRLSEPTPQPKRADFEDGVFSHIWQYGHEGMVVTLSFDYPFNDYHDVTYCYHLGGWKIGPRTIDPPSEANDYIPCLRTTLRKDPHQSAALFLSTIDENGQWLEKSPETLPLFKPDQPEQETSLIERLRKRLSRAPEATQVTAPNYRVQVLAPFHQQLDPVEEDKIATFFKEARRLLIAQFIEPSTPVPTPGSPAPAPTPASGQKDANPAH